MYVKLYKNGVDKRMKKEKSNNSEKEKFHRLEAVTDMYELFLRTTKEEKMIHVETDDKQFTEILEKMLDDKLLQVVDGEIANNGEHTNLRFSIDEEKIKETLENMHKELEDARRKNIKMVKNDELDEAR